MASGLRCSPCRPVQRPFLIGLASQLGCKSRGKVGPYSFPTCTDLPNPHPRNHGSPGCSSAKSQFTTYTLAGIWCCQCEGDQGMPTKGHSRGGRSGFWSLTGGILDLWGVQKPLKTGPSAHPGIYSEGARMSQRPHALDFCREHCILILSSQKQEQGIL